MISRLTYKLTFKLVQDILSQLDVSEIESLIDDNQKWISLSQQISKEKALTPYSPDYLRKKWIDGKATIVVDNGQIISFLSLNSFNLEDEMGLSLEFNIHETATGWTDPLYRKKGINLFVRKSLINSYRCGKDLFMSFTRGVGASYLLKSLNWNVISWKKYSFTSSFIGWFINKELYYKVGYGEVIEKRFLNNDKIISLQEIKDDYIYLWIDDLHALEKVELFLSTEFSRVEELRSSIKLINNQLK